MKRYRLTFVVVCVVLASLVVPGVLTAELQPTDGPIEYPAEIDTDREKLFACYSLIQEMVGEYNKQSAISETDKEYYEDKFRTFAQKEFEYRIKELLAEQNRLKERIRLATYTQEEWDIISGLDRGTVEGIYESLFGDKGVEGAKPTLATAQVLDDLKAIVLDDLPEIGPNDPIEDFTTYTEYDEGSDLTVDSNTITMASALSRTDTFYVYDDKGTNHFDGDYEHRVKAYIDASVDISQIQFATVANLADADWYDMDQASGDALTAAFYDSVGGGNTWYLGELDGGTEYWDSSGGHSHDIWYYHTVERDEGVGTYGTLYDYFCTVNYYGESGSVLEDTLSLTLHTSKKDYRYSYGVNSYDTAGSSYTISGDIEDLDLQEVPSEATPYSYGYILGGL